MNLEFAFIINSILLGVGLAMDAFSVSLANGLNEPKMKNGKMLTVAGVFAVFQAFMPMAGWICIHTILNYFTAFEKFIPWIALVLLVFIGGKMVIEGIRNKSDAKEKTGVGIAGLLIQGIATSIDALSVGFTIADYNVGKAFTASLIIGGVTFAICFAGLAIGKKFGTKISNKAQIVGGVILIAIGIEIFITGII